MDDARAAPIPEGVTLSAGGRREIARLTEELLPALVARLAVSSLGEIEVAQDGWRVRLRRAPSPAEPRGATRRGHAATPADAAMSVTDAQRRTATSPAVGYFSAHKAAAVGRSVSVGDLLGWVDVLGVRQDVVAPSDGLIGRIMAEPGEAVEYGQELFRIDSPASAQPAVAAGEGGAVVADGEGGAVAGAEPNPTLERDPTSSLSGPRSGALD